MTPFRTLGVGLVVAWGLLPAALSAAPVPDKPKADRAAGSNPQEIGRAHV